MPQTVKQSKPSLPQNTAENTESVSVSPFSKESQTCPLCEAEIVYQYVKPRLYMERDKDVDLRPRLIDWQQAGFEHLQPRLYYMKHCPKCLFTAGSEIFQEPTKHSNVALSKIRNSLTSLLTDPRKKPVVQLLSNRINVEALDYYQATKLHLLAIFQLQAVEQLKSRDAMDLGRYCLRLAWLFRDVGTNQELRKQFAPAINKLIHTLKKGWQEIPWNEQTALEMAENYYQTTLKQSHIVETDTDEISLLLIITRISLKLGKFTEAHKLLSMAKDKARKFESRVNDLLRRQDQAAPALGRNQLIESNQGGKGPSPEQLAKMVEESRKMKNLTDEVQRVFEDAKEEWQKKQLVMAKKIIDSQKDKSSEELRALLLHKKIDQGIVRKLLPEENKKKGGLLGLFSKK